MAKKIYSIIFTALLTLLIVNFLSIKCEAQVVTYNSYAMVNPEYYWPGTLPASDIEVVVSGYNQTAGIYQTLSYSLAQWNNSTEPSLYYWQVKITVPDDGCKWLINGTILIHRWKAGGTYSGSAAGGTSYAYPSSTETYPFSLSTTTIGTFVKPTINSEGASSSLQSFKIISNTNFSEQVYESVSGDYGDITNKINDWVKAVTYTETTTNIKYSIIEGKFNSTGNKQIPIGGNLLLFKIIEPPALSDVATISFG